MIKSPGSWTRAERDAASAILLERSPYEADGGELIGRDPRSIASEEFERAGITPGQRGGLDIIRAKCLDCCVEQQAEVRKCVAVACPNWPYRMGVYPFRKRVATEAQREQLARMRLARKRGNVRQQPTED